MDRKCNGCGGKLTFQLVARLQEYNGQWFKIENLPAMVCEQCGDVYYTPQAHDRVLAIVQSGTSPKRTDLLQVFDAQELGSSTI